MKCCRLYRAVIPALWRLARTISWLKRSAREVLVRAAATMLLVGPVLFTGCSIHRHCAAAGLGTTDRLQRLSCRSLPRSCERRIEATMLGRYANHADGSAS